MEPCGGKNRKNQEFQGVFESGNIIFWILIMVVLLGALSAAVMQGTRTSSVSLNKEQSTLLTSEILTYARNIKTAVQTLRIDGCADTDLSFDQTSVTGYNNPDAPSDNSCHIYHTSGGGIRWENINPDIGGTYGFTGSETIPSLGTTEPELIFKWEGLSASVCSRINANLQLTNLSNDPPQTNAETCNLDTAGCKFTGTYSATDAIDNAAGEFDNVPTACYNENGAGTNYVFYHVLIAR